MIDELKSISELDQANVECPICLGIGWVCENHPNKAWADMIGSHTCPISTPTSCCCGAGAPCKCNPLSRGNR